MPLLLLLLLLLLRFPPHSALRERNHDRPHLSSFFVFFTLLFVLLLLKLLLLRSPVSLQSFHYLPATLPGRQRHGRGTVHIMAQRAETSKPLFSHFNSGSRWTRLVHAVKR